MYKTLRKTSPASPICNDLKVNFVTYENSLIYKHNLGKTWKLINKTKVSKLMKSQISDQLIDDPKTITNGFNSVVMLVKIDLSDRKGQTTIR